MKRAGLHIVLAAGVFLAHSSIALALKDIETGQRPPSLSLPDRTGRIYTLEYFEGGPGVILFWSTWSPRSADALSDFSAYHRQYAPQGLKVLSVNVDGENLNHERRRAVLRYLEERDLPFPALLDHELVAFAAYGVMAHPSTVVVNREGRIAYMLGGYPPSLREELKDEMLKVLGLYVEPPPDLPVAGYVPKGGALQHYNLGMNLMKKGQPDRALTAFRRSIERDPSFIEPAVMLARLALLEGSVEEAEKLLKEADPETINRSDLHFLLGHLALVKGNPDGAERVFRDLQERSPEEAWGLWGLGMVALARVDGPKALEQMRAAAQLGPPTPEVESRVRTHLVSFWKRAGIPAHEEEFIALFPELDDLRTRYRNMFNLSGGRRDPVE